MHSKAIKALIMLLALITTVQALTVEYGVYDINNRQPITGVTVTVYNNQTFELNQSNTNTDGLISLYLNETQTYHTVEISKIGYYNSRTNQTYITDPDVTLTHLIPISTEGLIRLRFTDLTLSEHEFCIYFAENNRLDECYKINETVTILTNHEYIITPKITKYDLISNPSNIKTYAPLFGTTIIGLGFILAIIILFIGLLWRIIRK